MRGRICARLECRRYLGAGAQRGCIGRRAFADGEPRRGEPDSSFAKRLW
jgi:hypothetical protein